MVYTVLRLSIGLHDSLKIADMQEARTGKMSDVIGEAKILVKNYT